MESPLLSNERKRKPLSFPSDHSMTEDFHKLATNLPVSDALIEQVTTEEFAEVARVLVLHVAHYRARYGDVPVEESLEMLHTEKISDELAKGFAHGLRVLVEVLKALGTHEGEPGRGS